MSNVTVASLFFNNIPTLMQKLRYLAYNDPIVYKYTH